MASINLATNVAAIRTLVENWATAVRARDVNAILANHSPDIVMFDLPGPLQTRGIEAYRKTWDSFYAWSHDPVVFAFTDMNITVGDDVAFVVALMRCSGTEKSGERIALEFRLTIGLRKDRGQWLITHEHHSIPATE